MDNAFTKKQKIIYTTMLSLSAIFIGLFFFLIIERPSDFKATVYLSPIWLIFGYWIYKNIPPKVSVMILTLYIYIMSVSSSVMILFGLDANCSPFPKDRVRPVCMFITSIERYLLIFNPIYFLPCLSYASIIGWGLIFSNAKTKVNHSIYMLLVIIVITIFPAIFNIEF